MKKYLSYIALFLALFFVLSSFAACKTPEGATTDTPAKDTTENNSVSDETESIAEESESNSESQTTQGEETSQVEINAPLEGQHGALIENAYKLANGVNAYFPTASRDSFVIENQNVSLDYALKHSDNQWVNSIKSASGGTYVENTMDVYVRLKNGNTFLASESNVSTNTNLYRMGFYMYELRLESQVFATKIDSTDVYEFKKDTTTVNGIKRKIDQNGDLYAMISNESDPYIIFEGVNYPAEQYNYLQIVMKTSFSAVRNADIYLAAGSYDNLNNDQVKRFTINPGDDYITYNISLSTIKEYTGTVKKFRLDFNAQKGEEIYIKEIRVVNAGEATSPSLSLNRNFYAFSDKLHEKLQISASKIQENIAEIGMITKIPADTVEKLIVKDAKAVHTSLDGVDKNSVRCIGFDIKGVGVFGFILPNDKQGDQLSVTLEDGMYVIVQSRTPDNGTIIPSTVGTQNANDFYMGHRIYTDETHDFDALLRETSYEWEPLTAANFRVNERESENGAFTGYDPMRGVYVFTLAGGGFNTSYYTYPNKHYNLSFEVNGCETDRSVYLLALSNTGNLECAVLLNQESMMLPVPLEVGKNFKGDGEANIFNLDDASFSDVVFPLYLKAKEKTSYTLVDLYQNWGNFPLKQISWIQFHAPYYHLSTGVTETNCIVPWYTTRGSRSISAFLPDHRAMSAPLWENQPQHTSGGNHSFLYYTDADGNYSATESKRNTIDSYGPTYADLVMDYLTDDGKIRATYTHTEMPQTDENRAYYEMRYEVLEDVTFKNFKSDFSFYTVTDNSSEGTYKQFGYLNEQNECVTTTANAEHSPVFYVLGDKCPYFDYFDLQGKTSKKLDYVNLSFLVYNSEFIIGGEKCDAAFVVKEHENKASLSLNLDEVTLKAGDTFTINAIVMPWGSQESVYDSDEFAPDQNVRDVRQNTLLDPLTGKAGADCEWIESTFLPRFRTTNGKSAEFTLSGGENNVAVRIYGFDMLTAPKVYELIGCEWTEYVLNSSATPDNFGYAHYYDGYCVYYDGDGTYSYSFVVDMSGDANRTFKITADKEFEKWPEIEKAEASDPLDIYLDYNDISEAVAKAGGGAFSKTEVGFDNSIGFIRFYGKDQKDSYLGVYKEGTKTSGRYFVMKYRQPADNPEPFDFFEIYTGTVSAGAIGSDGYSFKKVIEADGEWHVIVCDIGARGKAGFVPNDKGEYVAKYLRIDIFNAFASASTTFDIAYVGMCDDIQDVFALEPNFDTVLFSEAEDLCYEINRRGDKIEEETEEETETETELVNKDAFHYYFDAEGVQSKLKQYGTTLGESSINQDDNQKYLKILSKEGGAAEGYFFLLITPTKDAGRYLTIKYKTSHTENFEIFSSTSSVYTKGENAGQPKKNLAAPESHDYLYYNTSKGFQNDGEWHVLVIDLSASLPNYKTDDNGKFSPYFLRLDLFSSTKTLDHTIEVDIAYIGFGDDLSAILAAESTVDQITYFDGTETKLLTEN